MIQKRLFLIIFTAILCTLQALAAFTPQADKTYYLYSPIAKAYLNTTAASTTAVSFQDTPTEVKFTSINGGFSIQIASTEKYLGKSSSNNWDVALQDAAYTWYISDALFASGNTLGYYISRDASANYLGNNKSCSLTNGIFCSGTTENAVWQIIAKDETAPIFNNSKKYRLVSPSGTYLKLKATDEPGTTNEATAASFTGDKDQATEFTINKVGSGYTFTDDNNHYIGLSFSTQPWNTSNMTKYVWTLVAQNGGTYKLQRQDSKYLGADNTNSGTNIFTNHGTGTAWTIEDASTPILAPETPASIAAMLNRIGGSGASDLISASLDESLAEGGKEVYIITSYNGKPLIKGSTINAIAAGIGYYLNHYAKVNLTWNNLTTNLSNVSLPTPAGEEKHVCTADYRYYLNYCTYSYSMSVWDEDRWMKEIDWMALHGVNMPLAIVGMEAVWKKLLTDNDASKRITASVDTNALNTFVPGPSYQAWWLMGNLQGMGGPNPDWWYTHQEELGKKIINRMRELGMEPVLPGFAGQVPTSASGLDAVGNGSWCSFTSPALVKPGTDNFTTIASKYYAALTEVFGESKYYSMDLFHETGAAPSGIDAQTMFQSVAAAMPVGSKWLIQQWQWSGTQGNSCSWVGEDKLVVLDLWSEVKQGWKNTYGGGKNFNGREMIYCMLHNFGGRTGIYGRLSQTINGYYEALNTNGLKTKGVGATPEGIETNPILYDALFELPWTTISNVDSWVANWVEARYGTANDAAKEAWALLTSEGGILNCPTQQQGVSEPIICARPALEISSASAWSTSKIYYNTQKVIKAADLLKSATALSGKNYSYDLTDVVRQVMTDQAQPLLAEIKKAYEATDWIKYDALVERYTTLITDIDRLLSTNEDFMLGRWTSMARNNAGSGAAPAWSKPNYADNGYNAGFTSGADWTEWNARKLITTWGYTAQCNKGRLRDYSQREWAGLLKDFYLPRWQKYFTQLKEGNNIGREDASWYTDEDAWCRNYSKQYTTQKTEDTGTVATELFPKYFGKFSATSGEYYINLGFPSTEAGVIDNAFRGESYTPNIVATPTISKIAIDLDGNGIISAEETAEATNIAIPADAKSGKALAFITMTDGTEFTFTALIKDNVTEARTVAVVKPTAEQGSVTVEGDNVTDADGKLSVTTKNDVTITAVPTQAYDFVKWTKGGEDFSTQNPYIYTEKSQIELTPVFAKNKWAEVPENKTDYTTVQDYSQYASTISFAPNAEEATEIYQTSTCPTNLYNVVPTAVSAAKGSAFTLSWTGAGLDYTRLSAYVDLNGDGDFSDEGEFVGTIGELKQRNPVLKNSSMQFILPYDATVGLTHVRLRFDGAYETTDMTSDGGREPYATTTRMVYDLKLNITEYSTAPTTTITAISVDPTMGSVVVTGGQIDKQNPAIVNEGKEVTLDAIPVDGYKFLQWVDEFDRIVSTDAHYVFRPVGSCTYRAEFVGIDDDYFYKGEGNVHVFNIRDISAWSALKKEHPWTITMEVETDGLNDYNEHGSVAIADGSKAVSDRTFQIYMAKDGNLYLNLGGTAPTGISCKKNFMFTLKYDGSKLYLYAKGKDAQGNDKEYGANDGASFTCSINNFTQLSCALPEGVNIKTLTITSDEQLHYATDPKGLANDANYVDGNGEVQLLKAKYYITNKDSENNTKYNYVPQGKAWQMVMDVTHAEGQKTSYNQWGSCILSSSNDPINTYYWNNFQVYEHSGSEGSKRGTLNFKSNKGDGNDHVIAQGHKVYQDDTNGYEDYRVIVRYDGGNVYLIRTIILNSDGSIKTDSEGKEMIFNNVWFAARVQHDIDVMSCALPTGTNIKSLAISIAEESNLLEDVDYAIQNINTTEYLSCHYLNGPDEHYLTADHASKFQIEFTNNNDLAFHDGDGGLHPTIYIKAEVYNEQTQTVEWKYLGADNKPVDEKANATPFLYSDNSKMIEPISNTGTGSNVTSSKGSAWSIADYNKWNFVFFGNYLVQISNNNINVGETAFGGITYKRNEVRNNDYVALPTTAKQTQIPNTSEVGYSATIAMDGTMLRVNYTPLEDTFYNFTELAFYGSGTTLYYWYKEQSKLIKYSTGIEDNWNEVDGNGKVINGKGDCTKWSIEKATSIPVKMNQNTAGDAPDGKYYSTIYSPNALVLPEGMTAYAAKDNGTTMRMIKIAEGEGILPAKTAAILQCDYYSAPIDFTLNTNDKSTLDSKITNDLDGTFINFTNPKDGTYYTLSGKNGIGFYKYTGTNLNAFKAFCHSDSSTARMTFMFDDTTGIDNLQTEVDNEDAVIYDLLGRRHTSTTKGIYIINGKKVLK